MSFCTHGRSPVSVANGNPKNSQCAPVTWGRLRAEANIIPTEILFFSLMSTVAYFCSGAALWIHDKVLSDYFGGMFWIATLSGHRLYKTEGTKNAQTPECLAFQFPWFYRG